MHMPFDPAIPLVGISPQTEVCVKCPGACLKQQDWKQSKCPSEGDELYSPGHIHKSEHYRDVKKNTASLLKC